MNAIEILKALCRENLDLENCDVFSTGDTPWDDLSWLFPRGPWKGNVECDASYFYYWGPVSSIEDLSFSKPDATLYLDESDSEIYLWKIE